MPQFQSAPLFSTYKGWSTEFCKTIVSLESIYIPRQFNNYNFYSLINSNIQSSAQYNSFKNMDPNPINLHLNIIAVN